MLRLEVVGHSRFKEGKRGASKPMSFALVNAATGSFPALGSWTVGHEGG